MRLTFTQGEKAAYISSKGFDKDEITRKMESIGWKLKEEGEE